MNWKSSADGLMKWKGRAEKGLQNYGKNIARNVERNSLEFKNRKNNKDYYKTQNIFPNPLKRASYE